MKTLKEKKIEKLEEIKKVLMEYITKGDMDDNVSFDNYINSFAEALESELQSLQGEQESKDPNVVCDQYHIRGKWSKEPQGAEAYLNNNGIVDFIIENNLRPSIKLSELLEQYHRAMTKEELIKFMKHCYDYRLQGTYDEIADKYLNQKK